MAKRLHTDMEVLPSGQDARHRNLFLEEQVFADDLQEDEDEYIQVDPDEDYGDEYYG